jgi:hypothetical protein
LASQLSIHVPPEGRTLARALHSSPHPELPFQSTFPPKGERWGSQPAWTSNSGEGATLCELYHNDYYVIKERVVVADLPGAGLYRRFAVTIGAHPGWSRLASGGQG